MVVISRTSDPDHHPTLVLVTLTDRQEVGQNVVSILNSRGNIINVYRSISSTLENTHIYAFFDTVVISHKKGRHTHKPGTPKSNKNTNNTTEHLKKRKTSSPSDLVFCSFLDSQDWISLLHFSFH